MPSVPLALIVLARRPRASRSTTGGAAAPSMAACSAAMGTEDRDHRDYAFALTSARPRRSVSAAEAKTKHLKKDEIMVRGAMAMGMRMDGSAEHLEVHVSLAEPVSRWRTPTRSSDAPYHRPLTRRRRWCRSRSSTGSSNDPATSTTDNTSR